MVMYSRIQVSGLSKAWPCQPSTTCGPEVPRPSRKRPPESASIVIAVMAVLAGVRAGICMMPVPSLMRVVCAPIQASGETASEPQASADQMESYPSASASLMRSISISRFEPEYPIVNPRRIFISP